MISDINTPNTQPLDSILVHEVIDIQFTRTFSGSSKPDQHRVLWQTSLPPESAKIISDAIAAAMTGEPS